jgi:cytosine/adenosine deaminase-related metal-dependent hydrolase
VAARPPSPARTCTAPSSLPGFVNTHHHLYQTLTRARAQDADLFTWLKTLYPVWARLDDEMEYAAARAGLAELALSGCSTVFDHHYVFPRGVSGLVEAELRAARELGLRFVASRGSMDLGESDGGLPPDSLVEDLDTILADTERLAALADGDLVQIVVAPCSPFSVTTRLMEESAALARRLSLQLHTHLAETLEEDAYCRELFGVHAGRIPRARRLGRPRRVVRALRPSLRRRRRDVRARRRRCRPLPDVEPATRRGGRAGARAARRGVHVGLGVDGTASNERGDLFFEVKQALLQSRAAAAGAAH